MDKIWSPNSVIQKRTDFQALEHMSSKLGVQPSLIMEQPLERLWQSPSPGGFPKPHARKELTFPSPTLHPAIEESLFSKDLSINVEF